MKCICTFLTPLLCSMYNKYLYKLKMIINIHTHFRMGSPIIGPMYPSSSLHRPTFIQTPFLTQTNPKCYTLFILLGSLAQYTHFFIVSSILNSLANFRSITHFQIALQSTAKQFMQFVIIWQHLYIYMHSISSSEVIIFQLKFLSFPSSQNELKSAHLLCVLYIFLSLF